MQTLLPSWLFAADGAHSAMHEQLKLHFDGNKLPEQWHLADVQLRTNLQEDAAHIEFFDKDGFIFLIRVIEDTGSNRKVPGLLINNSGVSKGTNPLNQDGN